MEELIKDFWTCGIFLSKEPFNELAIKCFMCESLYLSLQEFQKHLFDEHLDDENVETKIEPILNQNCEINNDPYFGVADTESLELFEDTVPSEDKIEKQEELYENFFTEELQYPINGYIQEVEQNTSKKDICKICNKFCSGAHRTQASCRTCFKIFRNRASLFKHELSHKKAKSVSICDKCGLAFGKRHQLQDHLRMVHEKLRPYLCSKCPKTYARRTHLNDHMRSHSPRRDYVCNICEKPFRRSQDLSRHKLLHQTKKKYTCGQCEATFRQHSGLYKHLKTKHKEIFN